MKTKRLRALVLAAGRGSRLRPLTSFIPKPLLPVRGQSVIAHTIEQLAGLGCEAIAVNLFHRSEMIKVSLGDSFAGIPLIYSAEKDLLGTLGALAPLRGFLSAADVILIVNGDSLCRWPFRGLIRRHLKSGAAATLLVSRRIDPRRFGGGVGVMAHRKITSMRPGVIADETAERRVFMGAHALSPALLERIPDDGPANFVPDLYEPLLQEDGHIAAVESSRRWHDLGTPERYRRGVLEWGRRRGWMGANTEVSARARHKGSVVESDVRIGEGGVVTGSVILSGARIGGGCRVVESIVGPGVNLPPHTTVERRMVTRVRPGAAASEEASVVGGLVYEPI